MTLIALTGGIASGKSMIGSRLAERGAVRIDADQLARDAVAPSSQGLKEVVQRFGAGILSSDGTLDRAALGALVFSDSGALSDLNAIVHPQVRRLAAERIAVARAVDPDAVIVYEIPLLAETEDASGIKEHWDFVVVADAPEEQRIQRMVALRGMAEADARNRIMNQVSDEQRRAIADVVIDTSGSEADTLAQVDALWDQVTAS